MPCLLSCKSKSVLAKPLEHQCSVATISPGLGANSERISPPHVPYSKLLRSRRASESAQRISMSHSRPGGSDDAAHRRPEASPSAQHSGPAACEERSHSLLQQPECCPISCLPRK